MFIYDTKPLRMLAPVTSAFPGMYTWRLQQRSLRNFNSINFFDGRLPPCAVCGAMRRTILRACAGVR